MSLIKKLISLIQFAQSVNSICVISGEFMSLKEQINKDLISALKNGDKFLVSVLRFLNASIKNKEVEKRTKLSKTISDIKELEAQSPLNDEETIEVIMKECSKRRDAITEFEKANRLDLVNSEKAELDILKKYLPEQMPEEEIRSIAQGIISKIGEVGPQQFGQIMNQVMKEVKGKTTGDVVSKIVKELLG